MIKLRNRFSRKILTCILQLLAFGFFAQSPQLINYQGAARLADGTPLDNSTLSIKFDIHEGSSTGSVVVSEVQTVQTNLLGLFSTQIGKSANLAGINWQSSTLFLEVSMDVSGGSNFISLGTQQMISVPYAMHASSVPSSYTNNILTVGGSSYAISPTVAVTPNTNITASGIGTITSPGTNSFDINIPAPNFTGQDAVVVSGAFPNYTISSATPSIAVTSSAAAGASVISAGSSFSINVPPPTFTNTGQTIISGSYPNFTVNTPTVGATPVTSINASGLVSVTNPATNSFVIGVQTPTFTNSGQNIITGNYPNFTVNTPTVPAAITPSIAVTSSAAAGASVAGAGSSFSINIPPPTFTNTGQTIISGSYPNFTVNTPTIGSTPITSISPSGLVSVTNPATNSFVIDVPPPTFTNTGQNIITGSYPNFTVNTPTVAAAVTPSIVLTATTDLTPTVNNSGSSFSLNIPPPTFTNTGQTIITGTYPDFTVSTPTVAGTSIAVSSTPAAAPSVSVTGTNSFNINIPPQATDSWSLTGNAGTSTLTNFIGTTDATDLHFKTNGVLAVAITTLGNVGIGTANPAALLHVVNTVTDVAYFEMNNSGSNNHALVAVSNSNSQYTIRSLNNGSSLTSYAGMFEGGLIARGKNALSTAFAFKAQETSGSDLFVVRNDGNVGIGTNAPAAKLHVLGTLRLADGTQGAGKILTSDALGNASWQPSSVGWGLTGNAGTSPGTNFLGTSDAQDLVFKTSGLEAVRINTTGNVSIGTTANQGKLEVETTTTSASAWAHHAVINFNAASGGGGLVTAGSFENNFNGSGGTQVNTGVASRITLLGGSSSSQFNTGLWGGAISMNGNHNNLMGLYSSVEIYGNSSVTDVYGGYFQHWFLSGSASITNGYGVYVGPVLGTNRWSFYASDASAPSYFAGNVGINNSTPSATLDVAGTVKIADGTQGSGKVLTSDASGNASWQTAAGSSWVQAAGVVTLASSTDKVGIGTNNPVENLQVESTGSSAVSLLSDPSNGSNLYFGIQANHTLGNIRYLNTNNSFNFGTNNVADRLVIDGAGNVGVGTASPNGNFHVKSSGASVLHRISSTGAPTGLVTYADAGSSAVLNYENTPLYFGTNGANRMVISNTGAVGINESSPTATLHVNGTTRLVDGTQGAGKVLTSDASGNASWQAPAPATTSRLRSISIDASMINVTGVGAPPGKSAFGGYSRSYLNFPDGVYTAASAMIAVPKDWNGSTNMTVTILYSSPATSGDFYILFGYAPVALNANVDTTPLFGPNASLAPSSTVEGLMESQTTVFVLSATDRLLNILVQRNGPDVLDSSTSPMHVWGFRIDYYD